MKIKIKVEKEVDVKLLQVSAGVRYWEDAIVDGEIDESGDLIPCREGNMWKPLIDIDNGKIVNWEQGVKADIHYKVCDAGSYFLVDSEGNTVASLENSYVPEMLCPSQRGYGDYIIMSVDENGVIKDFEADFEEFLDNDE